MPNKPRPDNPNRAVRVETDLWEATKLRARESGTTVSAVIRQALRIYVSEGGREDVPLPRHAKRNPQPQLDS